MSRPLAPAPASLPPGVSPSAHDAARRLLSPIQRFLAIEATSGALLFVSTIVAMVWANSALRGSYHELWHASMGVRIASWEFFRPLHFWVNDGLMTIFFFVVGLEIRREIHEGELSELRRAALPLAAALGGMCVPALLYLAFNAGREGAAGWGVAMATDIAFAVGALTILGRRVVPAMRVLLLALAVIDDLGAILVIAIFYSEGVSFESLALAALTIAGIGGLRRLGLRTPWAYLVPAVLLWAFVYKAGIHPTLAGVVLGMLTPVRPWLGPQGTADALHLRASALPAASDEHEILRQTEAIGRVQREALAPGARLQHLLHPWVAFLIMPIFALANAGVELGGAQLDGGGTFVFLGIFVGLVAGKPLGVFLVARISIASGLAIRPSHVPDRGLAVVGMVAGIGFTMAIFIAQLAFPPGPLLATAKLAVIAASATALVIGIAFGLLSLRRVTSEAPSEHAAERSTTE